MTLTELINTNRVFGTFMGYEIIDYKGDKIYNGNKYAKTIGELKNLWNGLTIEYTGRWIKDVRYPFNTDFNYLIPIIRRIEELGYVVAIVGISYKIYRLLDEENPIVSLVCGDRSKKTEMTCDLLRTFIEEHFN